MHRKYAQLAVLDAWRVPRGGSPRSLRKAAHRVAFDYVPRPGYLYVRARAISSRTNDNHDTFPAPEIEKSYRTFLGKPCFVNHHNANHRRARGVIVAAALHRDRNPDGSPDVWVELLHEIDAQTFPRFAKAILSGRVNRTSMGVDCEYSTCSACGNKATSPAEYCQHMPGKKGMKIRQRNTRTGKLEEHLIHEICAGLTFFENSFLVEDPADPTAHVLDKPYLHPVTGARKTAAPAGPHPGRLQGGTCRENCTYGGTHCAVCHDPVRINLHKTDINGGWHHHDGMRRDHEATPADPEGVMASVPGQQAAKEQAREHVREVMHRQFEELSGHPLPRRLRGDEGDMPRDPFLAMRRTADQDQPYMLRMMRHMTDVHGVPHDVLPLLAAQKYRDRHGENIHPPGAAEGPEGESAQDKIRRMTDTGRAMAGAQEGIQLAHQELHGGDYAAEGGMAGFRHSHGFDDELAYRHEHPYRPDSYKPGRDEPPDPRFAQEERAVVQPYGWRGESGIPDYMKTREPTHRLHPDRTDEHPNRSIYDDGDDPGQWSNLGNCPRTYTRKQQDRSRGAASGEPGVKAPHEDWQAWHDKARRNGAFCPTCGAHKWMHAEFRPSETGRPTPQYEQEKRQEWEEKVRGKTAPFVPLRTTWSSRAPDLMLHFMAASGIDLPEATCPSCGSPRARAHSQMHEMAQCSDCGTHYNQFTGREMEPDEVDVTNAAHANYEEYEEKRKAGEQLFRHVTPNYTHPVPGWDEAREWREQWHREDLQPHPMSGAILPKYPPRAVGGAPEPPEAQRRGYEDWARRRREHVTHAWSDYPEQAVDPTGRERLSMRRQAITGEEAQPGHQIWAEPQEGPSPVAGELRHNMMSREPEDWYRGLSYHGPYHIIRHPQTRQVWLVDRHGRDANPMIGHFGNPQRDGHYGESVAEEHWRGLESVGPDAHRTGTAEHPKFTELMESRTPEFPHSRIDPEDVSRAGRPDARVHAPEGHQPEDEWHGPYEVVRHPETGRFHVVDNAGRHAPMGGWQGFQTQMQAERSRDYIDQRMQSKEQGRALADKIYGGGMEVLDPGGTEESRESEENTRTGQELMTRYAGGRGQIKTEPDEEGGRPYYERDITHENGRPTGWYARHYGGPSAHIYHRATGDETHDDVELPSDRPEHEYHHLPDDFDDIELARHLREWYHRPDGMRQHLEEAHWTHGGNERIQRWKQRHQGVLQADAALLYKTPDDHPFFQAHPASKDHIKAAWHDSTQGERDQGKRWYPDAQLVATAIAHGDTAKGAGLLSAYSPKTFWPANMFNAARSVHEGRAMGTQKGDGSIMEMHWRPAQRIMAGEHHSDVFSPKTAMKTRAFAHLIEHGGNTEDSLSSGKGRMVVIDRHALSTACGKRLTDEENDASPIGKPRYYHHVEQMYLDAADELSAESGTRVTPEHLQATVWLRQIRKNNDEDRYVKQTPAAKGRATRNRNAAETWRQHAEEHYPQLAEETMHAASIRATGGFYPGTCPTCGSGRYRDDDWPLRTCKDCGTEYGEERAGPPQGSRPGPMQRFDPGELPSGYRLSSLRRQAADPPLRVPPSVDTLRPEACPVCGDQDVFKGQRCPVCGFVAPPDIFRDPDIDQARANREALEEGKVESAYPEGPADEAELEAAVPGAEPGMNPPIGSGEDAQDQLMHPDQIAPDGVPGVQPEGAPGQGMLEPSGEEEQPGEDGELLEPGQLDENGQPVNPEEEQLEGGQLEEEGQEEQAEGEELEEQGAGGEQAEEEAEEEGAANGSPGKEQDEDERPGGKMPKRTAATTAAVAQQRVIDGLRLENAKLHAGLRFIAELAGVSAELDDMFKQADLANPAQPVPDPPEAPPTSTTEQALATGAPTGSGSGTARGPGHTEDDPSRPGTTPGSLSAVPAEQTTTALTPGVEMQTAPASQLVDVTAPVTGTNPSQDGGVPMEQRRIETDVRVNPNPLAAQGPGIGGQGNDGTAFPWTIGARQVLDGPAGPEDERGARTMASIRLARLRITAGLARGDDLEVCAAIEQDRSLTLHDIEREISTLSQVARTAAQAQPRYPRGMAPRQAAKAAPSFAGPPAPVMAMTAAADTGGDDSDLFID